MEASYGKKLLRDKWFWAGLVLLGFILTFWIRSNLQRAYYVETVEMIAACQQKVLASIAVESEILAAHLGDFGVDGLPSEEQAPQPRHRADTTDARSEAIEQYTRSAFRSRIHRTPEEEKFSSLASDASWLRSTNGRDWPCRKDTERQKPAYCTYLDADIPLLGRPHFRPAVTVGGAPLPREKRAAVKEILQTAMQSGRITNAQKETLSAAETCYGDISDR